MLKVTQNIDSAYFDLVSKLLEGNAKYYKEIAEVITTGSESVRLVIYNTLLNVSDYLFSKFSAQGLFRNIILPVVKIVYACKKLHAKFTVYEEFYKNHAQHMPEVNLDFKPMDAERLLDRYGFKFSDLCYPQDNHFMFVYKNAVGCSYLCYLAEKCVEIFKHTPFIHQKLMIIVILDRLRDAGVVPELINKMYSKSELLQRSEFIQELDKNKSSIVRQITAPDELNRCMIYGFFMNLADTMFMEHRNTCKTDILSAFTSVRVNTTDFEKNIELYECVDKTLNCLNFEDLCKVHKITSWLSAENLLDEHDLDFRNLIVSVDEIPYLSAINYYTMPYLVKECKRILDSSKVNHRKLMAMVIIGRLERLVY